MAGCRSRGVPSRDLGDCTCSREVQAAESHGGTATTAERHGILSVFVPLSFTFMVSVGMMKSVLPRDVRCAYYTVHLLLLLALVGLFHLRIAMLSCWCLTLVKLFFSGDGAPFHLAGETVAY